jgi:hypothetical protein
MQVNLHMLVLHGGLSSKLIVLGDFDSRQWQRSNLSQKNFLVVNKTSKENLQCSGKDTIQSATQLQLIGIYVLHVFSLYSSLNVPGKLHIFHRHIIYILYPCIYATLQKG